MSEPPLESLVREVKDAYEAAGSYLRLDELTKVDRRKLKKIVEGENVSLTIGELRDLDHHLRTRGRGLARVFSPRGVVRLLAEHGHVLFVAGSQPDEADRRIDFSRWDVRTLREVLQSLNATGLGVHFTFEDVIHRPEAEQEFGPGVEVDAREAWYHLLGDEGRSSVVCLGSAKACHASEVMLARMAGVDEFRTTDSLDEVPFAFVWPDDDDRASSHVGAFRRSIADLAGVPGADELERAFANPACFACGLYDGERIRVVDRRGSEWDSYAVIAVQRRPGNQLWVVLAGLTGPATLGAAMVLPNFVPDQQADSGSKHSPLEWAVVTVRVRSGNDRAYRCDERRIVGTPTLDTPIVWSP